MENNPIRKLSDEQREQQLREGARRKRPWTPLRVAVTVLFFGVPLGLLAWLIYPRPKPPEVIVIAFDQLAVDGEKTKLQTQLLAQETETDDVDLEGIPVWFEKAANGKSSEVATDKHGIASTAWTFSSQAAPVAYRVTARSGAKRRKVFDRGNVYCFPKDAKLLFVDVEKMLPAKKAIWKTVNVHDVQPDKDAVDFLKKASAAKFRPVYFAFEQDSVWDYRKLRGWVDLHVARKTLPPGPVLGKFNDGGVSQRKLLQAILAKFDGPVVALVKPNAKATLYHGLKMKTATIKDKIP